MAILLILIFAIGMMLLAFTSWVLIVFTPGLWHRIIAVENKLTVRLGVPPVIAAWMLRHETGPTMKFVAGILTVLSLLLVMEASHLLR
jgi:hypothetical protein